MPALRTPRVRTRLSNPQEPPPGMTPVTYGDGLLVDGSEVAVDFGTDHDQVPRGDEAGGGSVAANDITDAGTFGKELLRKGTDVEARNELGLGDAALLDVGDSSGTVAAGDDARIVGAVQDTRTVAGHALSADVTLAKGDVGLGNVDNTSDANKPVSTAQAAADALALPKTGGTMSGAIAMGGNKVTGSVVPTAAGEAMVVPASVANGDTFIWSGGTLVRLPKGTDGQVFTLASGLPSWAAASGGVSTPRSGTYAAIGTASTYPGALYYVESGTNAGRVYQSVQTVSGTYKWTLVTTRPVEEDFSSGWTTVNGNGTASIGAGTLTLAFPGPGNAFRIASQGYTGPSAYRSIVGLGPQFDICARVVSLSAQNRSLAILELGTASSAGTRRSVWIEQTTGNACLYNNTDDATFVTASGRITSFTGQEWIRFSVRRTSTTGTVSFTGFTGVGVSGERPTTWTEVGTSTVAATFTHCSLSMMAISAPTPTIVFDKFNAYEVPDPLSF